jgi:C4-dicarboxylate transporter DctM subunit
MYLLAFAVIYLILGMFIDPIAIMVMTLPVMFPIMTGVGYDPIWLGVIAIKLAEISLITPPVGLNVYVVRSASPVPLTLEDVFTGVWPFLVLDVITLALLIMFPQIVLFLPRLML